MTAVANSKQSVRRQRLQPTAQNIVRQSTGNLKIAGTQRLIKAVFLVAVLIRHLRTVPAEVEKQVLLLGNTAIHGVLRHLQSAQDVSQRSSKHLRALNVYSCLVAAHHMAAKHHSALPKKGRKRYHIVRTSLQGKPAGSQVLVTKSNLNSKKLGADPDTPTHNTRNDMAREKLSMLLPSLDMRIQGIPSYNQLRIKLITPCD